MRLKKLSILIMFITISFLLVKNVFAMSVNIKDGSKDITKYYFASVGSKKTFTYNDDIDTNKYTKIVEWASDQPEIASVSDGGTVTSKKSGFAKITLTIKYTNKSTKKVEGKISDEIKVGVKLSSDVIVKADGNGFKKDAINPVTEAKQTEKYWYGWLDIVGTGNKANGGKDDEVYRSTQGMTTVYSKTHNTWYTLVAVIPGEDYRNNAKEYPDIKMTEKDNIKTIKTYVYIIDEKKNKVVAIIKDYSFGHANALCADNRGNIFVADGVDYGKRIYQLKISYVDEAVKKYKDKTNKEGKTIVISSNFTKSHLVKYDSKEYFDSGKTVAGLVYDYKTEKLYATNRDNLYEVIYDSKNKISGMGSVIRIQKTRELFNYEPSNSGAVMVGEYLFLGRFYSSGGGTYSKHGNTIYVYKCAMKNGSISSVKYVATYYLDYGMLNGKGINNDKDYHAEIEALTFNSPKSIALAYNLGFGKNDQVYELNLDDFNHIRIPVTKVNFDFTKGKIYGYLYKCSSKNIGCNIFVKKYETTENGNFNIRNIPSGHYQLKTAKDPNASSITSFEVGEIAIRSSYNYRLSSTYPEPFKKLDTVKIK